MGKSGSKPEQPKQEPELADNRVPLSRNYGEKYNEFWNRLDEIDSIPHTDRFKRPVRNSTVWRQFPDFQGQLSRTFLFLFFFRKMPFTNPTARIFMLIWGFDYCTARVSNCVLMHEDELNELKNFYLMYHQVLTWSSLRNPDYVSEHEDWYLFNKPGYRTPVGYEYTPEVLFRFLFANSAKYGARPVKWHGEWEQENGLVLDLFAPHNDHWLSIH